MEKRGHPASRAMPKPIGDSPRGSDKGLVCIRCRDGPSYHGGHRRDAPNCALAGCDSSDPKTVQAFLLQAQINKAVQEALRTMGATSASASAALPKPAAETTGAPTSSRTLSTVSSSSPPPPPKAKKQKKGKKEQKGRPRELREGAPAATEDDDPLLEPFHEIFHGETPPSNDDQDPVPVRMRPTHVRDFASPPADLVPPPQHSDSKTGGTTTMRPTTLGTAMTALLRLPGEHPQ